MNQAILDIRAVKDSDEYKTDYSTKKKLEDSRNGNKANNENVQKQLPILNLLIFLCVLPYPLPSTQALDAPPSSSDADAERQQPLDPLVLHHGLGRSLTRRPCTFE